MSDTFTSRLANLSPQQLKLLAIDLRDRLDRLQDERREPIAVVGLGCRFPGADGPDAFWSLVRDGRDAIRGIPPDRWPIDEFFNADPDARGTMATRWGGFLDRVDRFDAEFFGIAPREAATIDPQQRLLLEVTWEALEHAGVAPDRLRGSRTGVFVGLCGGDYFQLSVARGYDSIDTYLATGGSHSVASGRLSYVLGLEGPALSIDTACSSSLAAVHLAVRSLRNGECRMALAGGVNAILWPGSTIALSRGRMMAADGRCKAFDARGDGFVRGEGCGIVVLKRLSDARRDGDRVLAVIRGSASNQDGRSNGLTAPNGRAQAALIADALADAGLQPGAVSYVEAHGTGTPLGDPIELHALGAALSPARDSRDRVLVGSVKTNIGHLEGAAGVAGLIKTVLMLQAKQIPPSLHFEQPNPFIDWAGIPVDVATTLQRWEPRTGTRIAGVSAFGFSGTNVHVVLEEATALEPASSMEPRPMDVLVVSGRSETALRDLTARYGDALTDPHLSLADVCYTASAGRAHFEHRAAFVVRDRDDARAQLQAFAAGVTDAVPMHLQSRLTSTEPPRVAFLYSGQGGQFVGMGAGLYRTEPVFRAALDRCAAILDPLLPARLIATIHGADTSDRRIHDTTFTQPATLALQYALTELWRAWGVVPSFVMGHSLGEFAAACTAGVISIEDALPLVVTRARLMQSAAGSGAMVSVFAHGDVVRRYLAAVPQVAVAAFNGPDNTVISGPAIDVARVEAALVADGIEVRRLEISLSAHSAMLAPILDTFEQAADRTPLRPPALPVISNLTGAIADETIATGSYWRRHLREPVRFGDGMTALTRLGARVFLEIGPHPALISMARRYTTGEGLQWLASMRRDRPDVEQILETLGALHVQGVPVDWTAYAGGRGARKTALPTYAFDQTRHWIDVAPARRDRTEDRPADLPGRRMDTARGTIVYDAAVSVPSAPWLASHRVGGAIVAPGPMFVDIARAAASDVQGFRNPELLDFDIEAALVIPETGSRRVQTIVERAADETVTVEIASQDEDGRWTVHARGRLREADDTTWPAPDPSAPERCVTEVEVGAHYARLAAAGAEFGPDFRRLTRIHRGDEEAVAAVNVIAPSSGQRPLHPAAVDGCLHVVAACFPADVEDAYLMTGASRIVFAAGAPTGLAEARVHARLRPAGDAVSHERIADVLVSDAKGAPIASLTGVRLRRTRRQRSVNQDIVDPRRWQYELRWDVASPGGTAADPAGERWLIVGGSPELRGSVLEAIARTGGTATVVDAAGAGDDDVEARMALALDRAAEHGTPSYVLYLESAILAVGDQLPSALRADVERVCRNALALAQQLIAREWPARLWMVTAGATSPTGAQNVAGGALWGFGRTFGHEHPELWGGLVDLDAGPVEQRARDLVTHITRRLDEPGVALVSGATLVARIARLPRGSATAELRLPGLRADATYVVTGAFGGIGTHVVRWLIERGARHLALLVRRPPTEAEEQTLTQLRALGADVRVVRADVAVESDVVQALHTVRSTMAPIAGVLHVAGTFSDAVIERMDWPKFAHVLASKIDAAWNLHRHTRADALDHFVLFSSGGSVLGPVGLCNYAAANAGLDAIAQLRRAEGLPAVSIDWGPWASTGMAEAVGGGRHGQWAEAGFAQMAPADALNVLGDLMMSKGPAQALVVAVDWPAFRASATGRGPLFSSVAPASPAPSSGTGGRTIAETTFDLAAFSAATPETRGDLMLRFLQHEVARELGVPVDRLPLTRSLTALGLDSLMAVQLRNRVQEAVRTTIPVSRLIDGSTVAQLADELVARLSRQTPAAEPVEQVQDVSPVVVDTLSDAEVERMLLTLLAEKEGAA